MATNLFIEYDLSTATFRFNEDVFFIGKTKKRFWKIDWTLFDQSKTIIASFILKQKPFFLNCKLLIDYLKEEKTTTLIFFYKVWKAPHIKFEYQNDQFLIVFHIGNKFSFFKNGKQFALLQKEKISISLDKKYKVIADADTSPDILAIISYAILIITEDEFEQAGDFNVDLGNLGPELKSFDQTWKAKNI
jgi:hypothetical protein